MNRAYRIVLNRGTGQWRVAGEHARGRGKSRSRGVALVAVLAAASATPAAQALAGAVAIGDVTPAVNWNDSNDLVIGNAAFGSLLIESPATIVRSASGWLGATPDGVGTATVSGLGASWEVNGRLVVGANGSGTLMLANQGMVSAGANGQGGVELASNRDAVGVINIGSAPGGAAVDAAGILIASEVRFGAGRGTLNFNSTGAHSFAPALNSQQAGQHQLNHYAGITLLLGDSSRFDGDTTVTGGFLLITNILGTETGRIDAGAAPGASARVNVYNTGATWALTGNLFVGGSGPGNLNIYYQGTVSNHFATVDARQNGAATVTVSDVGALWNNRAALLVGSEGGKGGVSVLAGGYVASVDGVVGRQQNGSGDFLVSGRGSTWANAGELRVGDVSGQGTLSIESGGTVSNRDSYVGSMSGNGEVVVRGAGSTWNNSGAMILGFGVGTGAGTLTIGQGGAVNVGAAGTGIVSLAPDRFLIFPTRGTLNIGAAPGQPATGAGTLNAGAVQFGAGIATLSFNHTDTAYRFATRLLSTGSGAHSLNQIAGTTFLAGANGAFLGKTTVSGGKLVVLGQLGGSAQVTGGTLQYGDGASGAASRLAGDLKVSGAGSTLAVQGPATLGATGDIGMADHTTLDLTAGANGAPLRANTVTLGADVTFRLGGVDSASPAEVVLIDTAGGINGDFARISTGGFAGAVDYLSVNTRKSADALQYLARYGLAWTAGNNLAHGTFTLANATDRFTVGAALADQAANAATGWNGTTLTKAGAGTLVLSGANTYSGGTTVSGGTLQVERDANLGDAAGGLALNGGTLATTTSFDTARAIMVTQSGGFDVAANTTLGLTGVLSGGGDLIKAGEGVLDLKGDGAGFTGRTLVNGGRLAINGRLGGSLDVGAGGVLGGNGTIGAGAGSRVAVGAGGVLSPGNSIGTLTIDGDLVMQRGARLAVETDPAGAGADLVRVSGNATLNGGAVAHVGAQGDYALNASYTIMEVRGTLSGRFDAVSSDFAFLTPSLAYDYGAGRVSLSLARNDTRMAWTGATRNQRAAAAAIDSIGMGSGNRLYDAVVRLPDDPALLHAGFDQLSGELHASAKTLLLQDSRYLRDAMSDRLREAADGARSTPLLAAAGKDAGALATGAQEGAYGPASWIQGLGAWSRTDGDGNAAALKRSSGGFLMGLDAPLAQTWRVGVMAGYSRSDFDVNDRASSGRSDNYHLGAYGGGQWGALGLRGGVAYSWHDIATRRSVAMPGFSDRLKAGYDGRSAQAYADLSYRIDLSAVALEPFVNLAYVNLRTGGYRESGGAAALHAAGQTSETIFSTLGARATSRFELGGAQAALRGSLGWRHATGDVKPRAAQAFSAGESFTVAGVALARNSAVIEAGLDLQATRKTRVGLAYQGLLSGSARDHGVRANLTVRF